MKKAILLFIFTLAPLTVLAGIVEFLAEPDDFPSSSYTSETLPIFVGHFLFGLGLSIWGFDKNKVRGWFFALYAAVAILSSYFSKDAPAYLFFGWFAMYFGNQLLMPALDALDKLIKRKA